MRVGFIGLGFMGEPMARNVLAAGHELVVWNRTPAKAEAVVRRGGRLAGSPAAVAEDADVVLACLATVAASRELFLGAEGGDGGLAARARPGQIFVDHATVDPETSRACYRAFAARGAGFLDAPISGGPLGAAAATLAIMVGGDRDHFEGARPVFESMGTTILHLGSAGAGSVTKLVNQLLVGVHTLASCEALTLARRAGVDLELVQSVLAKSWGASRMLERNGPIIAAEDYDLSGSPLRNLLKDLRLVGALGDELGLSLEATRVAREVFAALVDAGKGESDITAACRGVSGQLSPLRNDSGSPSQRP